MIALPRRAFRALYPVALALAVFLGLSPWPFEHASCHAQENAQRFGLMLPISGVAKPLGEGIKKGVDLAVEGINNGSATLVAGKMDYYFEDTQCLDYEAQRAAEVILKTKGLKVIVGPVCGSGVTAVNKVRQEAPSVLIAPVSMSNLSGGEMTFHLWGDWNHILDGLAKRTRDALQVKTLAIVGVKTPYSESLSRKFAARAKGEGIKLIPVEPSEVSARDLNAVFTAALAEKPEALFLAMRPALLPVALKELSRINPEGVRIIAAPGLFIPPARELPRNLDLYFPVGWHASMDNPESRVFVEAYKARYGEIPAGELPAWGYAAVITLFNALQSAPLSDPYQLAQALKAGEADTPAGKAKFDEHGFANIPVKLARWYNGAWTTLE